MQGLLQGHAGDDQLSAPFRAALRFPLVQFAVVVALILLLQSADDN
jgi:hypothetical protein